MQLRLALIAALVLAACHDNDSLPPVATEPPPVALNPSQRLPPGHPQIDGMIPPVSAPPAHQSLTWKDPSDWKKQPPASSMRQAQYEIPKAGTDTENAQLVVYYFGEGQGGDVQSNVARWAGEFTGADAKSKTESRKVGTLPVTVVSAEGLYDGGMAMAGGAPPGPKQNWALLGAIAETPAGPWFFKMTGPKATVTAARPAFEALIDSLKTN